MRHEDQDRPEERGLSPELADKLPHIHRLLLGYYGQPPVHVPVDPLTQLIASVVGARSRSLAAQGAMRELGRSFNAGPNNWEPLRDASVAEIERAIGIVTFPEQKAPRLKMLLEQLTARVGSLTLEFLAKYRTEKIRSWLEQFEGVGPQISAAVVNLSTLRRRALAIDANHLRVVQRLCVVPRADAATTEERLMRLVPETWDAAILVDHHALIHLHGHTLCTFAEPKCAPCPLLKLCPTGQRNEAKLELTAP